MSKIALTMLALMALVSSSFAQNTFIDTVTITAPDPNASEAGPDPGLFEIRRSGPTNYSLSVFYRVSGSASNGVDYEGITESVMIPQGSFTASIPVKPIDDALVEGAETVVLQIFPSPLLCPAPACGYEIGWPSNATVRIADNDGNTSSNQPPFVRLDAPQDGAQFAAPTDVPLRAYAQDAEDGYTLTVEFFAGTRSLGFGTFVPSRCVTCPYYELVWSNVPPGSYGVSAKATDSGGLSSVSRTAQITVYDSNRPPGVNIFATDPIATEQPLTTAHAPDTATFTVRRSDGANEGIVVYYAISGSASNGEDYEKLSGQVTIPEGEWSADIVVTPIDDALVESTESVELTLLPPCPQCLFATSPCEVPQGTNCYPVGPYNKAVAYIRDNDSTSATNPPVVTIFASDPIAVEGQFCPSNWWWTTSGSGAGWQTNTVIRPTNSCSGSNTATFVVRRTGSTGSDLSVYYRIGGTASNGVDYVTLPGKVTITAGHEAARIEVLPIDDSIAEGVETVLLSLQPPPPGPATYLIGSPSRAAAIIVDNELPRPPCRRLSDGMFHLCAPGTNGFTFCIHTSSDLINWTAICTNVVTEGAVHFVDPDAADLAHRFYRVTPDANYSPPQ